MTTSFVCRPARLCWALTRSTRELRLTAPHARHPEILARPACTPAAIRAVLAANADTAVLQRYDHDLDAAFEEARERGDLTPLVQTVRRWWFEADAWRDPDAQRQFLARVDNYQARHDLGTTWSGCVSIMARTMRGSSRSWSTLRMISCSSSGSSGSANEPGPRSKDRPLKVQAA